MRFSYIIVTSASGIFNGSPLRNARDITIFDAFASLMVPWKIHSCNLIETALPIQFSLMIFVCLFINIKKYSYIFKFTLTFDSLESF